ncbi:hypothetical protein [Streptomyces sp. NPDC006368]|uniref:hypothetical protein n=1 Tax=Streptomyces sp. NPDC006368 TaxID=3156760 RepID=UPI0033B08457
MTIVKPGMSTGLVPSLDRGPVPSWSFIEEGRLRTIVDRVRPGDYLFVQFGHNDTTASRPERCTSPEDYKEYLREDHIGGARARGAVPVVVTPVSRRSHDPATGGFRVSFAPYAQKAIEVATEENVPLVDLSASSRAYLDSIGPEAAEDVFLHTDPGEYPNRPEGTADDTHFQRYGALQMARLVAREVTALRLPLSAEVRDTVFDVYDLGPAGAPVAASSTPVTATTAYTAQRGYGLSGTGVIERDRGPGRARDPAGLRRAVQRPVRVPGTGPQRRVRRTGPCRRHPGLRPHRRHPGGLRIRPAGRHRPPARPRPAPSRGSRSPTAASTSPSPVGPPTSTGWRSCPPAHDARPWEGRAARRGARPAVRG